ncbi:STAS domain protein [Cooperia oncophora]
MMPSITELGEIDKTNFCAIHNYTRAQRTDTPILRFDAPVIFTNVELLKDCIQELLGTTEKKRPESMALEPSWKALILDCSAWTYTDAMGIEAIKEVNDELRSKQVFLILANMKSSIRRQYALAGLFKSFHENQFCPTIADALSIAADVRTKAPAFTVADKNDLAVVK